jgi:O-antigen/teichoic acid export membrane protein
MLGVWTTAAPFSIIAIATYAYTLGLDIAMAAVGAVTAIGHLRVALALVQVLLGTMPGVLSRISLSAEAALNRRGRAAEAPGLHLATLALTAGTTTLLVPLCAAGLPLLVPWFLGPDWRQAATLVGVVTALIAPRVLSAPLASVLMATGRAWQEARLRMLEAAAALLCLLLLVRVELKLALSAAALTGLAVLIARLRVLRRYGVRGWKGAYSLYRRAIGLQLIALAALLSGPHVDALSWSSQTSGVLLKCGALGVLGALLVAQCWRKLDAAEADRG